MWRQVKKIWKLVLLILLMIITFLYAMFQGGFVSWFLLFSFLPFAIYALAIACYPLGDIFASRIFSKKEFTFGETLEIKVTLSRKHSFPLFFLIVEDCLPSSLTQPNSGERQKVILFPIFTKQLSFSYSLHELTRGEHLFKSILVKTGDLFGLIEKEVTLPVNDKIIVYPTYEEMVYRPIRSDFDHGLAVTKEQIQRDTTMATGVRNYQYGDRFSWINWKVSAKKNEMMVKEFEQRQSHDIVVIIDCAPDQHFELTVSFAASLIRSILRRGGKVGLLASAKERVKIPIRGGEVHLQQLFFGLAIMKDDSPVPLDRVVQSERFPIHGNGSIILITAQLSKSLIENASLFAQQESSCLIFLLKGENEAAADRERILTAMAAARGVKVVMIHEHHFSNALLEVGRG